MGALFLFLVLGLQVVQGQNLPAGTAPTTPISTVTFTWSLSAGNPPYYSVAVTSMGSVTYKSFPSSDMVTGEPYVLEFPATQTTQTEVFQVAEELNFFQGLPSQAGEYIVGISTKSLTYDSGTIHNQIFYLQPTNQYIERLTNLLEGISSTINFRRALERTRTQNPSSLPAELGAIGAHRKKGDLIEFQALAPALQGIASDPSLPETTRREAQSLLQN